MKQQYDAVAQTVLKFLNTFSPRERTGCSRDEDTSSPEPSAEQERSSVLKHFSGFPFAQNSLKPKVVNHPTSLRWAQEP